MSVAPFVTPSPPFLRHLLLQVQLSLEMDLLLFIYSMCCLNGVDFIGFGLRIKLNRVNFVLLVRSFCVFKCLIDLLVHGNRVVISKDLKEFLMRV